MKKLTSLLALAMYSLPLHAAESLVYRNKPVAPACFSQMLDPVSHHANVNLASCCNQTPATPEDGYITAPNHDRYAVLGSDGNKYLIVARIGTGGSGYFSSVVWVEKNSDTLHLLKVLASGDRCSGGAEKAGNWEYYVNMTPMDLVSMGSAVKLDAYRDLDTSATSCIAKAFYQFNPKTAEAKIKKIKLLNKPLAMESWVLQLNYQYCFTRLYNSYLDRGQNELQERDLGRFQNEFAGICVDNQR